MKTPKEHILEYIKGLPDNLSLEEVLHKALTEIQVRKRLEYLEEQRAINIENGHDPDSWDNMKDDM